MIESSGGTKTKKIDKKIGATERVEIFLLSVMGDDVTSSLVNTKNPFTKY